MPDPAAPLSASTLVLRAKEREIDAVRHLASQADLVDVIGQLIQALQRERGASSIYLASRGQRFADMRRTLVDEARPVEARLREVVAADLEHAQAMTAKTLSLMAWALLGLDAMAALRTQIERQAMSAHDSVAAFSHLIAGLIELVFQVADAAQVPSVSRLLVAFLHLVQAQEEAGQERAVGALLYASGQVDEAHQQRVVHLIDAQERSLQVFAEFADPALRARLEEQQLVPGVARLERLRRTLCTARPAAVLDSNLSDTWFNVCTERMDELWLLQVALVKRLREDCAARIVEAQQDLQDSRGLLRRLRDNPPPRTHAVDRFFDAATLPEAEQQRVPLPAGAESASLLDLLQAQSARMAGMEAELDTARRTLNERKVIDRAKGMLMSRLGINEDVAFRMLQKTSMDQNRRLLDVAEATLSLPDLAFASLAVQGDKGVR
ncbi:MAG: antitermination regulator [Rhodoferax sp.]|nr:antitermination regulator [Rhodoferax sp.]